MRFLSAALFLATLAACGAPTRTDLVNFVAETSFCQPNDTCVIAGQNPCYCGAAVNALRADEVDAFAAEIDCSAEAKVTCTVRSNLWCDRGRCVGERPEAAIAAASGVTAARHR